MVEALDSKVESTELVSEEDSVNLKLSIKWMLEGKSSLEPR